jgi:DNA repair exonuclease SbcCD ATPase subunit
LLVQNVEKNTHTIIGVKLCGSVAFLFLCDWQEKKMAQLRTEIEKIEEKIKGDDEKIDKVDEKMKEMKKEIKEVDEMIKEVDKELISPRNEEEKLRKLEDRKRLVVRINELLEESKGLLEERKGLVEERKWYVQRRQITNEIDTIIEDFEDKILHSAFTLLSLDPRLLVTCRAKTSTKQKYASCSLCSTLWESRKITTSFHQSVWIVM